MNFLGIGPAELIVILVVALVFVGPERLPRLAADIARTIREIRKYTGSLAAEFNEVIQDFEKDTSGERDAWKAIETGIAGAAKSLTDTVRDVRAEIEGAGATAEGRPSAASPSDTSPAVEPRWADIASEAPAEAPSVAAPPIHPTITTNGSAAPLPSPQVAEETR